MNIVFTKQTSEYTRQMRLDFRRAWISPRFIHILNHFGFLKQAGISFFKGDHATGPMFENYDIHHIVPLSGGGTNDFSNLCLIEKKLHHFLNENCFDPFLKNLEIGEKKVLELPDLGPVARFCDYQDIVYNKKYKTYDKKEIRQYQILTEMSRQWPLICLTLPVYENKIVSHAHTNFLKYQKRRFLTVLENGRED